MLAPAFQRTETSPLTLLTYLDSVPASFLSGGLIKYGIAPITMLDYPAVFRSRLLLAIGAVALFVLTFRTLDHSTALRPFLPYDSGQPAAQSPAELVSIVYDPRTEPNYVPRRPDVAKVSMLYGENELYVRAIDTHIRHSKRHGYPTYVLRKEMISGIWNKLLYLIHVMVAEMHKGEEGANWIM